MILSKKEIQSLIENKSLVISPLLEGSQIGELTVDFRLGYNFLVTIQGQNPFIDASLNNNDKFPINASFQETRRLLGDTFLLHPNQTILTRSLEYIKLPQDVYAVLTMRSSYLRMGVSLSAILQPGYCGCISIELTNINQVPINLTVGSAIFQARLYKAPVKSNYFSKRRKYMCQVRPVASAANDDNDMNELHKIWKSNNHL
jgi:dCTP deaminase